MPLERWLNVISARLLVRQHFVGENMETKRYLSTKEAAEYLGISVNTLRKYKGHKLIPVHKVGKRLHKYDRLELDAIMGRL